MRFLFPRSMLSVSQKAGCARVARWVLERCQRLRFLCRCAGFQGRMTPFNVQRLNGDSEGLSPCRFLSPEAPCRRAKSAEQPRLLTSSTSPSLTSRPSVLIELPLKGVSWPSPLRASLPNNTTISQSLCSPSRSHLKLRRSTEPMPCLLPNRPIISLCHHPSAEHANCPPNHPIGTHSFDPVDCRGKNPGMQVPFAASSRDTLQTRSSSHHCPHR